MGKYDFSDNYYNYFLEREQKQISNSQLACKQSHYYNSPNETALLKFQFVFKIRRKILMLISDDSLNFFFNTENKAFSSF